MYSEKAEKYKARYLQAIQPPEQTQAEPWPRWPFLKGVYHALERGLAEEAKLQDKRTMKSSLYSDPYDPPLPKARCRNRLYFVYRGPRLVLTKCHREPVRFTYPEEIENYLHTGLELERNGGGEILDRDTKQIIDRLVEYMRPKASE